MLNNTVSLCIIDDLTYAMVYYNVYIEYIIFNIFFFLRKRFHIIQYIILYYVC